MRGDQGVLLSQVSKIETWGTQDLWFVGSNPDGTGSCCPTQDWY
jgi:hypothetical protein